MKIPLDKWIGNIASISGLEPKKLTQSDFKNIMLAQKVATEIALIEGKKVEIPGIVELKKITTSKGIDVSSSVLESFKRKIQGGK